MVHLHDVLDAKQCLAGSMFPAYYLWIVHA